MKNIQGENKNLELFNENGVKVYEYYVDSNGFSWERTYDSNGKILTCKDSTGYSYEYTRDSNGNELTYKNSNGVRRGFDIAENKNIWSDEDMMSAYEQGARLALISQSDLARIKGNFPTKEEWLNNLKNTPTWRMVKR